MGKAKRLLRERRLGILDAERRLIYQQGVADGQQAFLNRSDSRGFYHPAADVQKVADAKAKLQVNTLLWKARRLLGQELEKVVDDPRAARLILLELLGVED